MNRTILCAVFVFLSLAAGPTTKPTLEELRDKVIAAQQVVDSAREGATKRMFESAEYKGLVADLAEKTKAFEDAKAGTPQQRLDASGPLRAAERAMKQFKADGWKHDTDYKKAVAEFDKVNAPLAAAEREILDKVEQARAAGDAERQKQDNEPIPTAIRKHEIIRGMTSAQAEAAMKRLTLISTTDAGRLVILQWKGEGRLWTVAFMNGVAETVSATALPDVDAGSGGHEVRGSFNPPR